jgi:hypothetical protein
MIQCCFTSFDVFDFFGRFMNDLFCKLYASLSDIQH